MAGSTNGAVFPPESELFPYTAFFFAKGKKPQSLRLERKARISESCPILQVNAKTIMGSMDVKEAMMIVYNAEDNPIAYRVTTDGEAVFLQELLDPFELGTDW